MDSTEVIIQPAAKRTRQEIESLIEQWRTSGKTKKDFCKDFPIKYQTFIGWTKRKKKESANIQKASPGFIPIEIPKETRSIFAKVKFTNGNSVIIYEYVGTGYLRSLLG